MANPHPKPGPGRALGSRNKINGTLADKLAAIGCDPAQILGEIATNLANKVDVRERAASTLMKFIYAQKRDVAITPGSTFEFKWADSQGEINAQHSDAADHNPDSTE
jgi:hypothetical protein